jgi:L-asparaginase II
MKDGAEGVSIFSMPDGRTCAFKIADGATRPFAAIMKKVFTSWSINAGIEDQTVMGGSQVVGEVRCALDL